LNQQASSIFSSLVAKIAEATVFSASPKNNIPYRPLTIEGVIKGEVQLVL
jgi:hypothetical protein